MAKTIWKFPLEITDEQEVEIPTPFRLLTIQLQNDKPCLWAIVEPEGPKEKVRILCIGTGHPIDEELGYHLGTIQLYNGQLIFHFFRGVVGSDTIAVRKE